MDKLKLVLQFLALNAAQKKQIVPPRVKGRIWEIFGTNIRTEYPLLCMTYECWHCLDHLYEQLDLEDRKLIGDIETILNLMIELPSSYEPIWTICEVKRPVEVDAERLWHVVERLAKLLLERLAWPRVVPDIHLRTFVKVGGLVVAGRKKMNLPRQP